MRESAAPVTGEVSIDLLIRLARSRITALVSAGSFADDVALISGIVRADLNIPVLACVAAGVQGFADLWVSMRRESLDPANGKRPWRSLRSWAAAATIRRADARRLRRVRLSGGANLCGRLAQRGGAWRLRRLEQESLRAAFSDLRTTTLFGDFAIDRVTGRQIGHKVLLVQWHGGEKVVIHPDAHADPGRLEFPAGLRLLLASLSNLYVKLCRDRDDEEDRTED